MFLLYLIFKVRVVFKVKNNLELLPFKGGQMSTKKSHGNSGTRGNPDVSFYLMSDWIKDDVKSVSFFLLYCFLGGLNVQPKP